MILPEPSRTVIYTTRNTVNTAEIKQTYDLSKFQFLTEAENLCWKKFFYMYFYGMN